MSAQDDGGPFHPTKETTNSRGELVMDGHYGASLRDMYAMYAMQGMLANPAFNGFLERKQMEGWR